MKKKGTHSPSRYYQIKVCPECGEDEKFIEQDDEWHCLDCSGAFNEPWVRTVVPIDHVMEEVREEALEIIKGRKEDAEEKITMRSLDNLQKTSEAGETR